MSAQPTAMRTENIITAKRGRARGWIDWRPTSGTRDTINTIKGVLAENADYLPMTARQIFYALVARDQVEKTERGYKSLSETLSKARRARLIPFSAIRDDGIKDTPPDGYFGAVHVERTLQHIAVNATLDPSHGQPVNQIVMTETAGMVPMAARAASGYGATVISAGGFVSVTGMHDLAQSVKRDRRPAIVWHIGDYDPSGLHLYQSLAENVIAFADAHEVVFRRLAVTPEQVTDYDLPMAPAKATDARTFDGTGTVQAEALPPATLSALIQNALAEKFDFTEHDAQKSAFEAGMAEMAEIRERLRWDA